MQPHQQRVVDEKDDLDHKIHDLHVFITDNLIFKSLRPNDQILMIQQLGYMQSYTSILTKRIERFK